MDLCSHEVGFFEGVLLEKDEVFVSDPIIIGVFRHIVIYDGVGQVEVFVEEIGVERPGMAVVGPDIAAQLVIT